MNLSDQQAKDEILTLFTTAWNLNTPPLNGSAVVALEFDGVDAQGERDPTKPWARVMVQQTVSEPVGLGGLSNVRYTRNGIITVQVFTPLSEGGPTKAEQLSVVIREALEGKTTSGGVWFRVPRITVVGQGAGWYQINTTALFQFDQIR